MSQLDTAALRADTVRALATISSALSAPDLDGISITTDAQYALAGEMLTTIIKPGLAKVVPVVKAAKSAHNAALDLRRPWQDADTKLRAAMAEYDQRRRQAQERERKQIEAAARQGAETDLHARAAELVGEGREEEGLALLAGADGGSLLASPLLPATTYRPVAAAGVTVRPVKRFRVIDASQVKREFLTPDLPLIRTVVESMGDAAAIEVGGIEVYDDTVIGGRAR